MDSCLLLLLLTTSVFPSTVNYLNVLVNGSTNSSVCVIGHFARHTLFLCWGAKLSLLLALVLGTAFCDVLIVSGADQKFGLQVS